MKACEGFADRLQVLSHLLHYCLTFNAAICIDWRDETWGQGIRDFSDYFDIVGVPLIDWRDVPETSSIVPSTWTMKDLRSPMRRSFLSKEYLGPIMEEPFEKIDGDIIVSNGDGFRKYHIGNIIGNIRIKPRVVDILKEKLSQFYLPCTVIHIRGTDRYADDTISKLLKAYEQLLPHETTRVYIVSDSKKLVDEWLEHAPTNVMLNNETSISKLPDNLKCGSHQLSYEILDFYGTDKDALIIDCIVDFIALSYGTTSIGQESSVYYKMARFLNQTMDSISNMIPGYSPQRKKLTSPIELEKQIHSVQENE
jgi:hypothetical protein